MLIVGVSQFYQDTLETDEVVKTTEAAETVKEEEPCEKMDVDGAADDSPCETGP